MPLILITNSGDAAPPPPAARLEFMESQSSSESNVATHDFTSVPFGADTADRQIHVVVMINADAAGTISCQIGDDAAPTLDASRISGTQRSCHIFRGSPTGTSGTISVDTTGTFDDVLIATYRSIEDLVPFEVNQQALGSTLFKYQYGIEVPDGGCVIAGCMGSGSSNANTHTWNGLTEDASLEGAAMAATNLFGCASAASRLTHTGQSVEIITHTQVQTHSQCHCAVSYGIVTDVPTIVWTNVFTGAFGTVLGDTFALVNDTVRSRLDEAELNGAPGSPTHIRVTVYAGTSGGWGCDKTYIGNGVASPNTDASALVQLMFGGAPAFSCAARESAVSDPLAFVYGAGTTDLQFSYLVGSDAALDQPAQQTIAGSPWLHKSDVDEADDAAVTGYTAETGANIQLLGIIRIEIGVEN